MDQDNQPFALVVRFTVRSGSEATFDDLVAKTADGIRTREPGTLVYACHHVEDAPQERIFYELYANRAAFEAHEMQDHTRHFLTAREPLLESTRVDFLSLADGKTPTRSQAGTSHG
jgi:quinol monooxygenase YgiN